MYVNAEGKFTTENPLGAPIREGVKNREKNIWKKDVDDD